MRRHIYIYNSRGRPILEPIPLDIGLSDRLFFETGTEKKIKFV